MENQLTPFEGKEIRKVWLDEQWYFSIIDVIQILTDSPSPSKYWSQIKKKDFHLSQVLRKVKMPMADGKNYPTDCANTEGIFRIIMSVPSPKAEPFKHWLAALGKQAVEETENPELGFERMTETYKAKGHTEEWITNRLKTIDIRKELTDTWKKRGVVEGVEYAILTATIAKGTFGLNPTEHSKLKGLERQNLRDHMTPLELIFTALSEEITRTITTNEDAQGFNENFDAAQLGGEAAGNARRQVEKVKGVKVVSSDNFLGLKEAEKPNELSE
jgi:prophage antirepressor-like protein